jgi:hypothetical protein
LSENRIPHLLKLAGVSPSDERAAAWLREAIDAARANYRAAKKRPLAVDHNALLADIKESAKELIKRIGRLRRYPTSQHLFWRSQAFGPVLRDRVEVREVLSALEGIVRAADMAKDSRQGRRRETGKQHVVNLAFGFFDRFSPNSPSGTSTGAFATFAREFYSAAIESDPERYGGLERQIRQAARSFIKPEPTQRKSAKKPRLTS